MAVRHFPPRVERQRGGAVPPRWLLLLLAVLAGLVAGESAGIVMAICGASTQGALSAGFVAFGSTLLSVLTSIGFLTGGR